jgi:hypothetical protein
VSFSFSLVALRRIALLLRRVSLLLRRVALHLLLRWVSLIRLLWHRLLLHLLLLRRITWLLTWLLRWVALLLRWVSVHRLLLHLLLLRRITLHLLLRRITLHLLLRRVTLHRLLLHLSRVRGETTSHTESSTHHLSLLRSHGETLRIHSLLRRSAHHVVAHRSVHHRLTLLAHHV